MASRKNEESQESGAKGDVRSLRSKFEQFSANSSMKGSSRGKFEHLSGNISDKGYGAQNPTRSRFTTKSSNAPDIIKQTWPTGQERRDSEMANYESMAVFKQPLCLIETHSDGKLKANENVLAQIKEIDHPLNIVCIAGPYRTGKSYLLNRLAGQHKGFALGSTIESKTKGIWVWCRPHPIKKDQVLLLLDTEGLGDIQKGDKNHDNKILSLGILLSSTMVYNIPGKLSSDDLQTLSFVTEISKNIRVSDKIDIEESSSNLDRFFPTFVLTLRDFTLDLVVDGKPITSDEYFEDVCLKMQQGTDQKSSDNNRARLCMIEYFKTRKCFIFDRPGGREVLRNLEELQDSDLQEDFLKDTKLFKDYVYNECPPKQMDNGQPVNGRRFGIIVGQYVDAIRKGKVPNVMDALATMVNLENERAVEESVKIYLSGMSKLEYPTLDNSTLPDAHRRCFDDALAFFLKSSMYDEEDKYYNMANSQITKEYENFRTRDQQESMKKSQKALGKMDAEIKQKVADRYYLCRDGYKLYLKDMDKLETDFCALTGLGCKKTDALAKYISDNANRGQILMQADAALTQKEKEIETERQNVAEAERKQAAEKRYMEEQIRLREEENRLYKDAFEQMKQKYDKELQNERDNLEKLFEKRREEMERLLKEGMFKEAERVKLNMEKAQKEIDEYKNRGTLSHIGRKVMGFFRGLKFW